MNDERRVTIIETTHSKLLKELKRLYKDLVSQGKLEPTNAELIRKHFKELL